MSTKKLQVLDYTIKQAENADTLDGQHASDFATASDMSNAQNDISDLQTKVGDTSVSTQIAAAVNSYDETNKQYISDQLGNYVSMGDHGENWSDGDVIVVDVGAGLIRSGGKYVKSVNGQTGDVTISETPLSTGAITIESDTSNLSHGASISALTDLTVDGHEICYTLETYKLPVETTLSIKSSGTGNAVTDVGVNNHAITLTKGSTFATQSSLENLSELVGDTSVSSQISNAVSTKQNTITGAATTIASSNLTASRALVSNSSGKVAVSAVTSKELGYLKGVSSSVQEQINLKADNIHSHDGQQITPAAIELTPTSSSAGHGGYIDFHYNGSSNDYTSRIIESSSGLLALNDNKILTAANITALYNVNVTFSSGKVVYSHSAIKSTSICFVQRRSGTAGAATTCMFATTSNNGSVTIVIDNTSVATANLNILILNL